MKRLASIVFVGFIATACNKPDEDSCKKAIENMRKLMGTQNFGTDLGPAIRRCRSGSSKASVECASKATSRADLEKCGFAHLDEAPKPDGSSGSGSGSGSGSASASSSGSAGSAK